MALTKLHHSIQINVPVEKVWDTMLGTDTYPVWTKEFNPEGTSSINGDWNEGSKILFIGTDDQGNMGGMVSRIAENRRNEFLSIEHLGELNGDQEDTTSERALKWKGAHENYTFKKSDNGTLLSVDVDMIEEFKDYMNDAWPKALQKLKELSEQD